MRKRSSLAVLDHKFIDQCVHWSFITLSRLSLPFAPVRDTQIQIQRYTHPAKNVQIDLWSSDSLIIFPHSVSVFVFLFKDPLPLCIISNLHSKGDRIRVRIWNRNRNRNRSKLTNAQCIILLLLFLSLLFRHISLGMGWEKVVNGDIVSYWRQLRIRINEKFI